MILHYLNHEAEEVKWKQAQECFRNAELVVFLTLDLDIPTFFVAVKTFYINHTAIAVVMVILWFSPHHKHSKS